MNPRRLQSDTIFSINSPVLGSARERAVSHGAAPCQDDACRGGRTTQIIERGMDADLSRREHKRLDCLAGFVIRSADASHATRVHPFVSGFWDRRLFELDLVFARRLGHLEPAERVSLPALAGAGVFDAFRDRAHARIWTCACLPPGGRAVGT